MPFPIGRTADKHEEWLNPIPGSRRGEGNAVPEEGERQIVSLLYELIENGYDKRAGVLYAPSGWPCPLAVDTMEVKNWQNLRVELRDGKYCSFHECDAGANMVSKELKDLLLSFIGENENIEFLPVTATSKEYGNKTYYIDNPCMAQSNRKGSNHSSFYCCLKLRFI